MESLSQQHCLNHSLREAVARCPECKHFYCRECITEHDDRVICASCLKKLVKPKEAGKHAFAAIGRVAFSLMGLVMAWAFFYWLGQSLLSIPAEFHEGKMWTTTFWEE